MTNAAGDFDAAPIVSLISKSTKALRKLPAGTWQRRMLRANVSALRVALALMDQDVDRRFDEDVLRQAHGTLQEMIGRVENVRAKFAAGTSQYILQRNRLRALRSAVALVAAELKQS